ncbi:MAG: DUF2799 domain-containing protein [Cellvibrionaceae bacterium]
MRTATIILSLLVLGGCAGLSKEECLTADWRIIGLEDGAVGHNAARIGRHRQDCAKHGVTPDKTAYDAGYGEGIQQYCSFGRGSNAGAAGDSRLHVCPANSDYHAGYDQGLKSFCTYDSGYSFGLAGGNYGRVCPPAAEANFLDGYVAGNAIFTLRSELNALGSELHDVVAEREAIEQDQDVLKRKIILDGSLTAEDRAHLLLDIEDMRKLDDELKEQQDALTLQISDVQAQLIELGVEI